MQEASSLWSVTFASPGYLNRMKAGRLSRSEWLSEDDLAGFDGNDEQLHHLANRAYGVFFLVAARPRSSSRSPEPTCLPSVNSVPAHDH